MVKNKKVTINNTNLLLDSTSTTTNYNDIYNDNNYIYNYIYTTHRVASRIKELLENLSASTQRCHQSQRSGQVRSCRVM